GRCRAGACQVLRRAAGQQPQRGGAAAALQGLECGGGQGAAAHLVVQHIIGGVCRGCQPVEEDNAVQARQSRLGLREYGVELGGIGIALDDRAVAGGGEARRQGRGQAGVGICRAGQQQPARRCRGRLRGRGGGESVGGGRRVASGRRQQIRAG